MSEAFTSRLNDFFDFLFFNSTRTFFPTYLKHLDSPLHPLPSTPTLTSTILSFYPITQPLTGSEDVSAEGALDGKSGLVARSAVEAVVFVGKGAVYEAGLTASASKAFVVPVTIFARKILSVQWFAEKRK